MKSRIILFATLLAVLLRAAPAAGIRIEDKDAKITEEQKLEMLAEYEKSFCPALENPDDPSFGAVFNIRFLSLAVVTDEVMKQAEKTRADIDEIMADSLRQTFTQGQLRDCSAHPRKPVDCVAVFKDFEPSILGGIPEDQIVSQLTSAHATTGILECVVLPVNTSGLGRETIETLPFLIGWNGSRWSALGFLKQDWTPEPAAPAMESNGSDNRNE